MEQSDESIEIPSATLQTKIQLESPEKRNEFVKEYVEAVKGLIEKYSVKSKEAEAAYNVILAIYPEVDHEEGKE